MRLASLGSSARAFPITLGQRGARRERVVVGEDDALYRDPLASQWRKDGREGLFARRLTRNPVHRIHDREDVLGRALREAR